MMLPSNTKIGAADRSSGRQKPLVGQWDPVFAISPRLESVVLLMVLSFFMADSPLILIVESDFPQFLGLLPILESREAGY
jgi:hypothetical protein